MKEIMFIRKERITKPLPRCLRNPLLRKVTCTIDACLLYTQSSGNYTQQGRLFSSYKSHCCAKVLIAVAPSGGAIFISDVYEGSITDLDITRDSGFLDHLEPGDRPLADRGFQGAEIEALFEAKGVKCITPPKLNGRSAFTDKEAKDTQIIARGRVHVERFNKLLKDFKICSQIVSQMDIPLISQAVYICCCLTNFHGFLAK